MSEPESPTSANDRTYRFISDPGHKENLSGRVRAACLTCRKKKIKCSGELNCRTCREKGLVCEGLPERKKPSKRESSPPPLGPVPAGIHRKKKISLDRKQLLKQKATLSRESDAVASENSSYANTQAGNIESIMSLAGDDAPHLSQPSQPSGSQPAFRVNSWSLQQDQDDQPQLHAAESQGQSTLSPTATPASAVFWPPIEGSGTESIWPSAASEDQLHPIQQFFSSAQSIEPNGAGRRQTIALPLGFPRVHQGQATDITPIANAAYDALALLLAGRTAPSGLTPSANEFSSWLDAHYMDFASMAGPTAVQAVQGVAVGQKQQQTTIPQSNSTTRRDQIPARDNDYFGDLYHNWPHE